MTLLRNYGFTTTLDSGEFEFSFEIPDNCNYATTYDATKNVYTVSIQLNSGQSQPSSTFNTETCNFNDSNGVLNLRFQQTLNGVTSTRPKIVVESNM